MKSLHGETAHFSYSYENGVENIKKKNQIVSGGKRHFADLMIYSHISDNCN